MELNEIKKRLYVEAPTAKFFKLTKGVMYYVAHLSEGKPVHFSIPITDIGDAAFYSTMEAKLLIRYMNYDALHD
jgi:hypothetical protein